MDTVDNLYSEGKLLVRAMDAPQLINGSNGLQYDATSWANEFLMMMNGSLTSASSTLIIPDVGVATYKNIGFLINSDLVECHHIAKSDSGSSGNISTGNFHANEADFQTLPELANYIATSRDNTMNEVNINASINAVEGLFFIECPRQDLLLQNLYVAKACLKDLTGIDYPIYSYDAQNGKLNYVELTSELEAAIRENLRTTNLFYWPDEYEQPVEKEIGSSNSYTL